MSFWRRKTLRGDGAAPGEDVMRGWGCLILAMGMLLATVQPGAAERLEAVRLQGLVLLREPQDGATMQRALSAGQVVSVIGRTGDYVEVRLPDGATGYVQGGFLTGFSDIAPLGAYADRIDASVTRPVQPATPVPAAPEPTEKRPTPLAVVSKPATPLSATPEPAAKRSTPLAARTRHVASYRPVADGGGLALYLARLLQPRDASPHALDERVAEFNASQNRYSIEVHLSERRLYLYENFPDGTRQLVHAYTVAVPGRDMEAPQGWGVVTGISFTPWWRPTSAMKERAKKKGKHLPDVVKPGVRENPMGTFKIILSHGDGYRIHGNNNPGSIGRPVTSGCIRMRNDEGRAMAKMIDVGTEVVFVQ